MKTTLDLNDSLLSDAKILAAQQRTTLTRLIEEGLQLRLRKAGPVRGAARAQVRDIPVHSGRGGLMPGLSATSGRAILDAIDDEPPA